MVEGRIEETTSSRLKDEKYEWNSSFYRKRNCITYPYLGHPEDECTQHNIFYTCSNLHEGLKFRIYAVDHGHYLSFHIF